MTIRGASGWGDRWGVGWGLFPIETAGPSSGFSVAGAIAISSNTVRVTLTEAIQYQSPIGPNDAANLRNWSLVRLDTNASILILTSLPVDGDGNSIDLVIMGSFATEQSVYQVTAANLVSLTSDALIDPKNAIFAGMPVSRLSSDQARPLVDVFNPQADGERLNGALVVTTSGDYQLEGGVQLLKKLIIRRLLTAVGEFLHLAGQPYGLGLQSKEFLTQVDLVSLKKRIELQVKLEPEVGAVVATVSQFADGRLVVLLQVQVRATGQQITMSVSTDQTTSVTL